MDAGRPHRGGKKDSLISALALAFTLTLTLTLNLTLNPNPNPNLNPIPDQGGAALPVLPPPSLAHVLRTVPGRAPTIVAAPTATATAAAGGGAAVAAAGPTTDRGGKLAARFGAAPARPAPPALPAPPRAAPPTGAASTSGGAPPTAPAPKSNGLLAEAKARLSEQGYRCFIQVLEDI